MLWIHAGHPPGERILRCSTVSRELRHLRLTKIQEEGISIERHLDSQGKEEGGRAGLSLALFRSFSPLAGWLAKRSREMDFRSSGATVLLLILPDLLLG